MRIEGVGGGWMDGVVSFEMTRYDINRRRRFASYNWSALGFYQVPSRELLNTSKNIQYVRAYHCPGNMFPIPVKLHVSDSSKEYT